MGFPCDVQAAHDSGDHRDCVCPGGKLLLVYALNQQVKRERERRGNYWSAYAAIVRFGQHLTVLRAEGQSRVGGGVPKRLSVTRAKILQNYFQDLQSCTKASVIPANRPPAI